MAEMAYLRAVKKYTMAGDIGDQDIRKVLNTLIVKCLRVDDDFKS